MAQLIPAAAASAASVILPSVSTGALATAPAVLGGAGLAAEAGIGIAAAAGIGAAETTVTGIAASISAGGITGLITTLPAVATEVVALAGPIISGVVAADAAAIAAGAGAAAVAAAPVVGGVALAAAPVVIGAGLTLATFAAMGFLFAAGGSAEQKIEAALTADTSDGNNGMAQINQVSFDDEVDPNILQEYYDERVLETLGPSAKRRRVV